MFTDGPEVQGLIEGLANALRLMCVPRRRGNAAHDIISEHNTGGIVVACIGVRRIGAPPLGHAMQVTGVATTPMLSEMRFKSEA